MKLDEEHIKKELLDQIRDAFNYNSDQEIIDIDLKQQTVTVKFTYNVVEEDGYIGFECY